MLRWIAGFIKKIAVLVVTCVITSALLMYFTGPTVISANLNGKVAKGCEVEIDGKHVGFTPYSTTLYPGPHDIMIYPPDDAEGVNEAVYHAWTFSYGWQLPVAVTFTSVK